MSRLTLLTRPGCPGSPEMLGNIQAALSSLGRADPVASLDLDSLSPDDPRTGYGSPTLLVDGIDLMGDGTPAPAAPM